MLVVLQLRIYAMYGQSKKILIFTLSVFTLSFIAEIVFAALDQIKAVGMSFKLSSSESNGLTRL